MPSPRSRRRAARPRSGPRPRPPGRRRRPRRGNRSRGGSRPRPPLRAAATIAGAVQVRLRRAGPGQPDRGIGLGGVRRRRVGIGEHRHAADAGLPAGAEDPAGDLAPVGDQQPGDQLACPSQPEHAVTAGSGGRRRPQAPSSAPPSPAARSGWRTGRGRARSGCPAGRSRRHRRSGRTGRRPATRPRSAPSRRRASPCRPPRRRARPGRRRPAGRLSTAPRPAAPGPSPRTSRSAS